MSYRVGGARGEVPSRGERRVRASAVVALGVLGMLVGAWACVPRAPEQPVHPPPAARGFLPAAEAAPAPEPALLPAPEPPPAPAEVEENLRRSLEAGVPEEAEDAAPAFPIAAVHEMSSTAYCLKGKMRTGVRTRDGVAAADPGFLPLGSVVRLSFADGRPLGVFVIMDTGGAVKGKKIDIYMESCGEARRWGRKKVLAEVLDLGRVTG